MSPAVSRNSLLVCLMSQTFVHSLVVMALVVSGITDAQLTNLDGTSDTAGLFPVVFNLATRARISANATCGLQDSEVFCKLVEHVQIFPAENRHCDICNARSSNPGQRHPIENAIDGSNRWWQSPTLTNGEEFNHVTVTLDLGAIYQVAYVIVKAANSPRPGNWVLERSIDGQHFQAWQYFAMTDEDCWRQYRVRATVGVPTSLGDDQVVCTSRYSKLDPLEGGEIFVSIVNGRPGVFQPSRTLLDFTSARYVQLRLQKIRTLNADLMVFQQNTVKEVDPSVTRRYFYSIKDISIGGQCICYGHATYCRRHDSLPHRFQCQCQHNTGGDNCEGCLPLFNNRPWRTGGIQGLGCEECNCHGKASECVYNATVDALGLSVNIEGKYSGGGVCLNCQEFTTGINCDKCVEGHYRPRGYSPSAPTPCRRCNCQETSTSTSRCVQDDSRLDEGLNPGECVCKHGFGGPSCTACAFGYYGYPNCRPCPCNPAGSVDPTSCERPCNCKTNVGGRDCSQCKPGFFHLDRNDPLGCTECFCFGVTTSCQSANWGHTQIYELDGWMLSTVKEGGLTLLPRFFDGWLEAKTYLLNVPDVNVLIGPSSVRYTPSKDVHYWLAPMLYLGNRMSSYGGRLKYTVKFTLDGNLNNRFHMADPDLILRGSNMTIAHGRSYKRENQDNPVSVRLTEEEWYHLDNREPVTRRDFMTVLYSLQQLLIKATYHTAQDTIYLRDVSLDVASPLVMTNHTLPSVEQCQCPEGYAGLSCESCAPGWRREGNQLYGGKCLSCRCYNHATECNPYTGACKECKHNTAGAYCDSCLPGFYGDPRRGTDGDCKPCACPLISGNNFFAESCMAHPTTQNRDAYECVNCQQGYSGTHCERCAPGYYGNPLQPGGVCRKCNCGGNIDPTMPGSCDAVSGACMLCTSNTEGEHCQRCKLGYFGSAVGGDCQSCACDPEGSTSDVCDQRSGQCQCRPQFVGRQCDRCQTGYGDVLRGCVRCSCNSTGSTSYSCDPVSGQCQCRTGIGGQRCDRCAEGYFGFNQRGCQSCDCYGPGTNSVTQCDSLSGHCQCRPNVSGLRCDQCQVGYYGIASGQGCQACECHRTGSRSRECATHGQCPCQPGIGGRTCNQCQPGYYGYSALGCQRCMPCSKPGHICDPDTGQCVCPPNMEGPNCQRCKNGSYDFDSIRGCKRCNCTLEGSVSQQCDRSSGQCSCRPGFRGFSCQLCLHGYHGFPECSACLCEASGSDPASCKAGPDLCECGDDGQCRCKANVVGAHCDECAPGTFSLQAENPKGCTECYCFHRSQQCHQAPYIWSQVTVPTQRVTISAQAVHPVTPMSGYLIINDSQVNVEPSLKSRPLYWVMPSALMGDKTVSYNGKLYFIHYFDGPTTGESTQIVSPLVIVQGNGFEIHADVATIEPNHAESFTIRLHESYWRLPQQQPPVSRRLLMVVLQNITAIFIRATQDGQATYAEIGPVAMEVSEHSQQANGSNILAYGVEMCLCPERYSGLSCQNPAPGYFKVPAEGGLAGNYSTPETVIGLVRPCQCYSHSNICHSETGICRNCQHNTTGNHCDKCAPGFYGIATRGSPNDCMTCACPLPDASNNFSPTCMGVSNKVMCDNCSQGHTGPRCERCAPGYYGNPSKLGDKCQPCNCAPEGSLDDRCDTLTGQCRCRPSIEGRRCDGCSDPAMGVQDGVCISCYDGCPGMLLEDLANLSIPSAFVNVSGVIYPWEQLHHIKNETLELKNKLEALKSTSLDKLNGIKNSISFHKDVADKLYNKINFTHSRIGNVRMKSAETLLNATDIEKMVNELLKEIKGNISKLRELVEKLINKQANLNLTEALKQAQRILNVVLARDFTDFDDAAKEEGRKAEKLSELIISLMGKLMNSTDVATALTDLKNALRDLYNRSQEAKAKALRMIDEESQKIGILVAELQEKLEDISEMKEDSENMLKEGRDLNAEAWLALDRLKENIQVMEGRLSALDLAMQDLQRQVDLIRSAMPKMEQLYTDSWKHAQQLERLAQQLADLFEKVRKLAQDPMRAARAYQGIVEAINQSEAAVKQALKTVQDIVKLANLADLQDEVKRSINRSRQLLTKAESLLDKVVKDLDDTMQKLIKDLDQAQVVHRDAADMLSMLVEGLDDMPQGFGQRLNVILNKAALAVDRANQANITVSNIGYGIDTVLMPKIKQLQDFDINAIIHNVGTNIKSATQEAQFIGTNLPLFKEVSQKNMRDFLHLAANISDLRRKIDEARNTTNSMKLSLSGEGNCARSYRSQLAPSVTNDVQLGVKLNSSGKNMLLLLLLESPKQGEKEYLALEITQENRVRFTWDAGKGPGTVTHPLQLQVHDAQRDEAEKWYRILAKRIGQIGQLKVWPVKGREEDGQEVTSRSPLGISLVNFNSNTSIFLAGVEGEQVPPGVTQGKLYGCLGDVSIDGKPLGVYNFKTSSSKCKGCNNVPQKPLSSTIYNFNGQGYAPYPITHSIYRSAQRFAVSLEFKTFWDDSRLFFAGNSANGDFLSIDLVEGKILVEFYLGGGGKAQVQSNYRYNTNQWVTVTVDREKLDAVLNTYIESQTKEIISFTAPGPQDGLEIMGQDLYIGGLPDSYPIDKFLYKTQNKSRNFLGCMKNLLFAGSLSPLPLTGESGFVGISPGCKDSGIRQVGFYGDGYMMVDGVPLGRKADIGLSFYTKQPDALLLLSQDITSDNYYSVSLDKGKLEARLSAQSEPAILKSARTYNDGAVHFVVLMKDGRRLEMLVDDVSVAVAQLPAGVNEIPMGRDSNLYFGGVPITVNGIAASSNSLDGCIGDIITNERPVDISTAKQYNRADIGRCSQSVTYTNGDTPAMVCELNFARSEVARTRSLDADAILPAADPPVVSVITRTTRRTTTSPFETCSQFRLMNAGIEENAKTLGNSYNSFALISDSLSSVPINSLQQRFNITFEFRTFFKDGLFGLLKNADESSYFAAQLREGKVEAVFTLNKVKKILSSRQDLADGQWHSGQITKDLRRLRMFVDGVSVGVGTIDETLDFELPLFIGGLSTNEPTKINMVMHSLRGCVRNLHLNGQPVDITDTDLISGVEHCYASVEPGVGFTKDSFGVYDHQFDVGKSLTIEAEFKSSEREGILFVIYKAGVQLTLELTNGKIVFALLNQDDPIRVESTNIDPNAYCSYQWHTVKATLSVNQLRLKVDNGDEVVSQGKTTTPQTPQLASFYIGGVPTFVSGPLSISGRGLYGCMRSIFVNGQAIDWYALPMAQSLLRTACPL